MSSQKEKAECCGGFESYDIGSEFSIRFKPVLIIRKRGPGRRFAARPGRRVAAYVRLRCMACRSICRASPCKKADGDAQSNARGTRPASSGRLEGSNFDDPNGARSAARLPAWPQEKGQRPIGGNFASSCGKPGRVQWTQSAFESFGDPDYGPGKSPQAQSGN